MGGATDDARRAATGGVVGPGLTERLRKVVLEQGYTRAEEPFRLSSGGTSRDYVDLRRAVARGEDLRVVAEAVVASLEGMGIAFEAIGGMTMGADPVAHAVALVSGRSWFSVRKAEKSHGSRRRVEGAELQPGMRVVVFEDTVSTGRSLLEAYDVVAATGAQVVACCTILDRGDEARRRFVERSVRYEALLTYADLGIEPLGPPATGADEAAASEEGCAS